MGIISEIIENNRFRWTIFYITFQTIKDTYLGGVWFNHIGLIGIGGYLQSESFFKIFLWKLFIAAIVSYLCNKFPDNDDFLGEIKDKC